MERPSGGLRVYVPKAVLQSFTREISLFLGDGSRLAPQRLMRILTLEAGEIIMTNSAFLDGEETGSLQHISNRPATGGTTIVIGLVCSCRSGSCGRRDQAMP